MSKDKCMNPNTYYNRSLIEAIGEKHAYHVVELNNGHDISKAPNGRESILFNAIAEGLGWENAVANKAQFYSSDFRKIYGDWTKGNSNIQTDINGEPKFTEVLSAMQEAYLQKRQQRTFTSQESVPEATSKLYENRKAFTPILENLADKLNIPWQEVTIEDGSPSFYKDGKVYVDFNNMKADAPFHEYAHPLMQYLQISFPKEFDRLVNEASMDKALVAKVEQRYSKADLANFRNELVVTAIGENAVEARKAVEQKGLLGAVKDFIDKAFELIRNLINPNRQMNIESIAKMNLRELGFMMGVVPPNFNHNYLQSVYSQLEDKAVKKDTVHGNITINVPNSDIAYKYMDMFGWGNVDFMRGGHLSSSYDESLGNSNNDAQVQIKIHNPLSTKGMELYRKAEAKPKTTNAFFNNLVSTLNEIIEAKDNELKGKMSKQERSKLGAEKAYMRKLTTDIYNIKTLVPILEVINNENNKLRRRLDGDQSLEDIASSIKMLRGFASINKYYDRSNVAPDVLTDLNNVVGDIHGLSAKFITKYYDQFKQQYLGIGGYEDISNSLFESIRDINGMSLQTIGSSFSTNSIEQASDHIIRLNAYAMNQELDNFKSELRKYKDEFNNDFSFMIDGDFILSKSAPTVLNKAKEISHAVFETEQKANEIRKEIRELSALHIQAQAEQDYKKVIELDTQIKQKNKEIRDIRTQGRTWDDYHKYMAQYFDYEVNEDKMKDLEDDLDNLKELYYSEDANGVPVLDQKGYDKAVKQYDPTVFEAYLKGEVKYPNQGWRYFNLIPKEDKISELSNPKYDALSDRQKEFHNFFTKQFMDASNSIYETSMSDDMSHDAAVRSFISMPTEQAEKMKYIDSAKHWLKDLVSYQEGAPKLDLHGVFTGLNRTDMKFKPAFQFMEKGKPLAEQKFADVFTKYFQAGMSYKYKKQVENVLETAKEIAFHLDKVSMDSDGKPLTDIFGDTATTPAQTNVSKRVSHLIESYLYHDAYEDVFGNMKIGKTKIGGDRLLDLLNDFTRYRQLALNPFSGIGNLGMGTINNWTFAKRNEFFNTDDLRHAYFMLKNSMLRYVTYDNIGTSGSSAKITAMSHKFGIHDNSRETQAATNLLSKAFTFQESGEFINQMAVALAMMNNQKTVEALVGKGNKLMDKGGRERQVFDLFAMNGDELIMNNDEFDLKALGITDIRIFDMVQAIMKLNKEIHGDYDPLNKMYIKRTALGRAVATFRTWLPQAIMQRTGPEREDYQLSAFYGEDIHRKGRYISVIDAIKKEKGKAAIGLLGSYITGFVPFVSGNVSEDLNLPELDQANINQTLSEARIMTMLIMSTAALGKIGDDDKEYKDMSWYNFMYNMSGRMENELATFYYPSSSYKLFKQIIPAFDTLDQIASVAGAAATKVFNPDKDIYVRGFRKGTSKLAKETQNLFPITKQMQSVWSTLNVQYANSAYRR